MDINITLDLSERAHAALVEIAETFRDMVVRGGYLRDECDCKKMREVLLEKCAEDAQANTQIVGGNEDKPVKVTGEIISTADVQAYPPIHRRLVGAAPVPESEQPAEQETAVEAPASAPEPAPKRGRGRPPKKRENLAPADAISPPAGNRAPESEKSPQDKTSCEVVADNPAPAEPEKAPGEPAAPAAVPAVPAEKSDDPYHGMTLMQAVSALMAEVHDSGIELADANARVRKECEARGLPYNSAACLMKDLGYDATRKIALGL